MTSAWHGEVDHLGLPPRNGSISVSGNLIGAGKKGGKRGSDLQGWTLARFQDPSCAHDLFYNLTWLSSGCISDL